jgi:ATP-binding cassette subfamily B protein
MRQVACPRAAEAWRRLGASGGTRISSGRPDRSKAKHILRLECLMTDRKASDVALYVRLLKEARGYWPHIGLILLLDLLATPLGLLGPVPVKIVVDSVLGPDPIPAFLQPVTPAWAYASKENILVLATCLLLLIALLSRVQSFASAYLRTYTGEKLVLDFRNKLFQHAQRLSLTYHDSAGTADAIYRIQYDSSAITNVAVNGVLPFVTSGVTLVGMIYVTGRLDFQLALIALLISPILMFLTAYYRRRLRGQWRQVKRLESSALGVIQESMTSLRVVKAFGQEERERGRFLRSHGEGMSARLRVTLGDGTFSLLIGMTTTLGTAAILFAGARHVLAGTLTLGNLILIMAYVGQLYEPLTTIGRKITGLQSGLTAAERAYALLDEAPDVVDRPGARHISRAAGNVKFDDVQFEYEGGVPIIRGADFEVAAGTRVGVVGRTGVGKSTLMGLLTRFIDPTRGRILLDGVDLRDYRLVDLRQQYAIVMQDTVLFSTSVAENIAYGRPTASASEIEAAAEVANAHEFIKELPNGYDTPVGERGMRLSGGERQRIALARAFLTNAPILILDEPTSAVDVKTEASIMDAIERVMEGRTAFMVAHRLSTLEGCDLLLQMENGYGAVHEQVAKMASADG